MEVVIEGRLGRGLGLGVVEWCWGVEGDERECFRLLPLDCYPYFSSDWRVVGGIGTKASLGLGKRTIISVISLQIFDSTE